MKRPIPDKAEVALEFPDKLYIGTFERSSRFDAHLDETGISLTLIRTGDASTQKSVHMHIHYGLFAEILRDLPVPQRRAVDDQLQPIFHCGAADAFHDVLAKGAKGKPN